MLVAAYGGKYPSIVRCAACREATTQPASLCKPRHEAVQHKTPAFVELRDDRVHFGVRRGEGQQPADDRLVVPPDAQPDAKGAIQRRDRIEIGERLR